MEAITWLFRRLGQIPEVQQLVMMTAASIRYRLASGWDESYLSFDGKSAGLLYEVINRAVRTQNR